MYRGVYRNDVFFIETGDANGDQVILTGDSSMYIIWAIGSVNSDDYVTHHSKRISGKIKSKLHRYYI